MNKSLSLILGKLRGATTDEWLAVDVGAHHGSFSRSLAETGFFAKVIAYEANPETFVSLSNSMSGLDIVDCVNVALGELEGTLTLYSDTNSATASLLRYDRRYENQGDVIENSVPVVKLDGSISDKLDGATLRLLKIDTQGNDLSVLKGAVDIIGSHKPVIQTEFIFVPQYESQCSPADLFSFFRGLDYELYSIGDIHITREGKLAYCDCIFVSKSENIEFSQEYICIDDISSYESQIQSLNKICEERLDVINALDAELKRVRQQRLPPSFWGFFRR